MSKTMCKLVSEGHTKGKEREKFLKRVKNAKYFCGRCGRVAQDADHLCKPERMDK